MRALTGNTILRIDFVACGMRRSPLKEPYPVCRIHEPENAKTTASSPLQAPQSTPLTAPVFQPWLQSVASAEKAKNCPFAKYSSARQLPALRMFLDAPADVEST